MPSTLAWHALGNVFPLHPHTGESSGGQSGGMGVQ
jgi:hypothetical protein